jgi:hypothetical protein
MWHFLLLSPRKAKQLKKKTSFLLIRFGRQASTHRKYQTTKVHNDFMLTRASVAEREREVHDDDDDGLDLANFLQRKFLPSTTNNKKCKAC